MAVKFGSSSVSCVANSLSSPLLSRLSSMVCFFLFFFVSVLWRIFYENSTMYLGSDDMKLLLTDIYWYSRANMHVSQQFTDPKLVFLQVYHESSLLKRLSQIGPVSFRRGHCGLAMYLC